MRHQRRAKEPRRLALHVGDFFHDFDAAGLAAAAGMDLRLHHPDRPAERIGRGFRFDDRQGRDAARHWYAEIAQDRLGLIFVDVHGSSCVLSRDATREKNAAETATFIY
jgi:hypothetical protein